ncbi:hypothetical protein BDW62DRAFT_217031 [Aspergillus aurantiobrunneus]
MHFLKILFALAVAAPAVFAVDKQVEGLFPKKCFPNPCEGITFDNDSYVCGDSRLANGYVVDDEGVTIISNVTLPVGQKLDRFGSEYGTFLAPLGAPYIERSLPPSNLDTYDGNYPFNYHVYQVTREFVVGLGPIAPWFEQPGMGTQFVGYSNVLGLIEGGFLRSLNESEYDERVEYFDSYTDGPKE